MDFYENLAHKMNSLNLDYESHNVVFIDENGNYTVKTISLDDETFDKLIDRMLKYNADKANKGRCIMVKSPNRFLRALEGHPKSMITYCAPMEDAKLSNLNLGSKGALSDIYLIPDREQVAADIVATDPELLQLAQSAIRGSTETTVLSVLLGRVHNIVSAFK